MLITAFLCGGIFAAGLVVSGMTQPEKVIGFLDIFGAWDPTLAFVMVGAIGIHAPVRRYLKQRTKPLLSETFHEPDKKPIDQSLLMGAALFGVGWGVAGFCPGPAVASVASESKNAIPFVISMIVGMTAHQLLMGSSREEIEKEK